MTSKKVIFIANVDRQAGYSSAPPPPVKLVGQEVEITRPMSQWHGCWAIDKDGDKHVFSMAELGDEECSCRDCRAVRDAPRLGVK